jgi:pimeloyl-ACP methyl ester carboxylesterase
LSIGGAIALQLLLEHTEIFPAAVLIGTGARLRVLPEILQMISEDYPSYLSLIDQMSAAETTDRGLLRPFTEAAARCSPQVARRDFTACDRFDVMDRLGEIQQPVLVVVGTEDRLTPPKYADFLQRNLARTRRADVPAAGHLAPLEQPDAVNRILSEFLLGLTPAEK